MPAILVVLALWGFGEAIVLPVVPDVLLGILVLASPWLMLPLLGARIAGGVAGAVVGWWLVVRRPASFHRVLASQPGLGEPGLADADARLRRLGVVRGFAQVGPGLPLKAYLWALGSVDTQASVGRVAGLALVNRLARILPVALGFAALHPLAAAAPSEPLVLGVLYVAGWSAFYVVYWWRRDPRRRSPAPS